MLKIRLNRVGRRNDPSFRIIVTESTRGPKSRKYIEMIGSHDPKRKKTTVEGERAKYWMSVGAQASDTVHNILISEKIILGKKVNVLPKKSPVKKEETTDSSIDAAPKVESAVVAEEETLNDTLTEESAENTNVEPDSEPKEKTVNTEDQEVATGGNEDLDTK